MMLGTAGDKLVGHLKSERAELVLDRVEVKTPHGALIGTGILLSTDSGFRLKMKSPNDSLPKWFGELGWFKLSGPRIIGRDDFYELSAKTEDGISFTCRDGPPRRSSSNSNNDYFVFEFSFGELSLACLDVDIPCEERFSTIAGVDPVESVDEPLRVEMHAILPGIQLLFTNEQTVIETNNPYLGKNSGAESDTYIGDWSGYRFALIERDGDLHVWIRSTDEYPRDATVGEDLSLLDAVLQAVTFVHGCQPWPFAVMHWRNDQLASSRFRPWRELESTVNRPVNRRLSSLEPSSHSMIQSSIEFFSRDEKLVGKVARTLWLLREASAVPAPIKALTFCTLLEGLIGALIDKYGLKGDLKKCHSADEFRNAKEDVFSWLDEKLKATMCSPDQETPWSRFKAILNSAGYVRPKERFRAIADRYEIPWAGDMEGVFEIWNSQRNPLAHGNDDGGSFADFEARTIAISRLGGTINRLILLEMGYQGRAVHSPFEEGLTEIQICNRNANISS